MGTVTNLTVGGIAVVVFLAGSVLMGAAAPAAGCAGVVDQDTAAALDPIGVYAGDQLANAAAVMNAGSAMGLDAHGQTIGVMTAIGESSLKNLTHGDEGQGVTNPDGSPTTSLGLFQQQESWGTRAERLDPTTAATKFFTRMVTVEGWEQLRPTEVAHKVQVNADPDHYAKSWAPAEQIVEALSATATDGGCGSAVLPLDEGYGMWSDYGPRNTGISGASTWHPAIDIAGSCNDPVYAAQEGTVTKSDRLWLSVTHPDGYVISYLHTHKWDRLVDVGDTVAAGQEIAAIGNEGPSSGCHLDIRVNVTDTTNADVAALERSEALGGPAGYVNPERFFELFGVDICPPDWCTRHY